MYKNYDTYVVVTTMADIENTKNTKAFIKYKKDQATENRQHVLNALVDLCLEGAFRVDNIERKGMPRSIAAWKRNTREKLGDRKWVAMGEILDSLNNKGARLLERTVTNITRRYHEGEISNIERDELIEREKKQKAYVRRTVERTINNLIERGLIIRQNHKYSLSNTALLDTTYSSSYVGFVALSNLMENLHKPTGRTLRKNIEQLITFFGCYAFFCLLEGGRPIDDIFVNRVRDIPISKEEKDKLTESWILDVLQPLVMYKFFLQTFLNQIDGRKARRIKTRGKYHLDFDSFKAVPIGITPNALYHKSFPTLGDERLFYRLDENMYKKVTDMFKKMHPEIYWQLIKGSISNDPRGAKNNYARWVSDIPILPEYD